MIKLKVIMYVSIPILFILILLTGCIIFSISYAQNSSERNNPLVCDFVQYCSSPKEYVSKVINNSSSFNEGNNNTHPTEGVADSDIINKDVNQSNISQMHDQTKENDTSSNIDSLNTDITSNISLIIQPDIPEIDNEENSTSNMDSQNNTTNELTIPITNITTDELDNRSNVSQNNFENLTTSNSSSISQLNTSKTNQSSKINNQTQETPSNNTIKVSIVPGAITLADKAYSPNPIEVKVGQRVIWTNDDIAFHTVTSGRAGSPDSGKIFDSGLSGPNVLTTKGKTFEFTFTKAGEFDYFCMLHPVMEGKIIVK